jgi:two-component system, OmpR family, sensor histidine kinase SenX3
MRAYADAVDATAAASLAGVAGAVLGGAAVMSVRLSERSQRSVSTAPEPVLAAGVLDVLAVLRSSAIVLDLSDAVVKASPSAYSYGLVRGHEVTRPGLVEQARAVRRDGVIRESELELPRGPLGRGRLVVGVRVAPLGSAHVLLLVEDRTQARRVEEVRRDFVANVSHELKTPVGGMALLAEAIMDASDDPEAVRRFAERMQGESVRLTRLVKEIVDLSRLQVADTLHDPELLAVDTIVNEAVDRCRLVAMSHDIALVMSPDAGAKVYGDSELLITAVRNLVDNAVAYSPDHTRVAIGVRREDGLVEISVTDQGIGIADAEQGRIFERFYRVDPARSRATGGTGLGLAIVKHVCANHGGDVTVWSQEGQGATFTMRLPDAGNLPITSRSGRAGPADQPDDESEDE